jgi:acetyl-CoA carboxylase carboxyltransferase component
MTVPRDRRIEQAGELVVDPQQRLSVQERIGCLLDPDSFVELEQSRLHRSHNFGLHDKRIPGDGVVVGWGRIAGRKVCVYAADFRAFGGSLGEAHAQKIHKILDFAEEVGCPVIAIHDGGGARIQEGVLGLAGYGGIFQRIVRASGVIPQISIVVGPCAGGAAYAPSLTDFVFVVDNLSNMYVTGPTVIRAVTGEEVTHEQLGGAAVHASSSGVASARFESERECYEQVRQLIGLLPPNRQHFPDPAGELAPWPDAPDIASIVPEDKSIGYDIRDVIDALVDGGEVFEVHAEWAPNIVCMLGRLGSRTVGIVGNQPMVLAGALDIHASEKAARFVQMCDAFNIPLITLVDVPGFLPGVEQEHRGIIRHGAKLLYAYCNSTVPRIQVILRKAYGGAYIAMDSRSVGCDLSFAWPDNEIAVMGADGAVDVLFRRQLAAAEDPAALRLELIEEYRQTTLTPTYAAEAGLVDRIVSPKETRDVLIESLDFLHTKEAVIPRRKHGNQPV